MRVIRHLHSDSSCLDAERLAAVISDEEMYISDEESLMDENIGSTPMHIISEDMASIPLALCGFLAVNIAALSVVDRTLGSGSSGIFVLVPSLLMLRAS